MHSKFLSNEGNKTLKCLFFKLMHKNKKIKINIYIRESKVIKYKKMGFRFIISLVKEL